MTFFPSDIISKNTTFTILSRFVILVANFLIVVVTTQIWGSSGRGEIALVIADIAIITILSNVTCGSTIAFHAPKQKRNFLMTIAFIGAFVFSLIGSLVFSFLFGFKYFIYLFIISLLISLTSSISMFWLGKNNLKLYNILTLISPVFVLIYLLVFYFVFKITSINACFYAYYSGLGTVLITGIITLLKQEPLKWANITLSGLKTIGKYGFSNEFNYFIQFLNYRLSYLFIAKWLGLSQLGVFSIVVSCSEAVWIISKSMSAIHFYNVVNTANMQKSVRATTVFARQSFWISIFCLGILVIVPESLFKYVFGKEFGTVKTFLFYMLPGIIAMAVSNLYGHYFAGVGKLDILRNKALLGLFVTLVLLIFLLKRYELYGVCITLNVSYILSSLYVFWKFRIEKKLVFHGPTPEDETKARISDRTK
jgi:O-antigen/teichoic acid export membrane protein